MSKMIEFIEKEIEREQSVIKTYQEFFKTDKTEFDKQITNGYIQIHQKNINLLHQIKCVLEAWEVVKKHFEYQEGDMFNCLNEDFLQTEKFETKDLLIIKKALEVEDE